VSHPATFTAATRGRWHQRKERARQSVAAREAKRMTAAE
jgi:hypothetical protein